MVLSRSLMVSGKYWLSDFVPVIIKSLGSVSYAFEFHVGIASTSRLSGHVFFAFGSMATSPSRSLFT